MSTPAALAFVLPVVRAGAWPWRHRCYRGRRCPNAAQEDAGYYKAKNRQREPSCDGEQELPIVVILVPGFVRRRDQHQRWQGLSRPPTALHTELTG
jgi:hypothetical protein